MDVAGAGWKGPIKSGGHGGLDMQLAVVGRRAVLILVVGALTAIPGCECRRNVSPAVIHHPVKTPMTIAVAPAWNFSGSTGLDVNRFADLMASELTYAEGVSVVPVSRVLGVLAAQHVDRVQSPEHAVELTELLGADLILVFAVTEYDPYDPPSIGLSAQLYGQRPGKGGRPVDPVALSRKAALDTPGVAPRSRGLVGAVQRVFNAAHDAVVQEVKRFAAQRGGDESPYGWRKVVVSQQAYIRFCCHETIAALLTDLDGGDRPPADAAP